MSDAVEMVRRAMGISMGVDRRVGCARQRHEENIADLERCLQSLLSSFIKWW